MKPKTKAYFLQGVDGIPFPSFFTFIKNGFASFVAKDTND